MDVEKGREAFSKLALDNPEEFADDEEVIAIHEPVNDAINILVKKARQYGVKGRVESEKHWELLGNIIKFWEILWEDEAKEYYDHAKKLRKAQKDEYGSDKEGEAQIRHLVEIPVRLVALFHAIFNDFDSSDKKFMRKFAKRYPQFRIGGKI